MDVVVRENVLPDLRVSSPKQVPCLRAEHGILVRDTDELEVVLALLVCDERKIGIPSFAVAAYDQWVVEVVLFQELLWIVVTAREREENPLAEVSLVSEGEGSCSTACLLDVDLRQRIVDSLLLVPSSQGRLQERQQKLEPVPRLDLTDELIDGYRLRRNRGQQRLHHGLLTIDVQQSSDHRRCLRRVDPLHIHFDRLELLILIQVEDEVVDEVETVANDDERKLLG